MSENIKAMPIGRILRFLLGALLVYAIWPIFRSADSDRILGAVLVVVALSILYGLLHWLVSSHLTRLNRCLGAFLAILPVLLVFAFGGALGQVGALLFLGVSLLLAAVRADAGCEVMSIPSLVFGRRSHLICILFSPLDWVEQKIFAARRSSASGS